MSKVSQAIAPPTSQLVRPVRDTASTGWAIVGYSFALILLYVLVADKRVVGSYSKITGGFTTAANAFISHETDPIALLEKQFGYTPGASSSAGAASPSTPAAGAVPAASSPSAAAPLAAGHTGARAGILQGLQDLLKATPVNVSGKRLASVERTVRRAFPSLPAKELGSVTQRLLEETHTGKFVPAGTKEYKP